LGEYISSTKSVLVELKGVANYTLKLTYSHAYISINRGGVV